MRSERSKEAARRRGRDYNKAHPGESARRHRLSHARNPNRRRDRQKAWAKANPELKKAKDRRRLLKKNYGMTIADYERMFTAQNGRCAICDQPFTKTANIDHCHQSKKVRGLLCTFCNVAVGIYERLGKQIEAYLALNNPTPPQKELV
jgi:hypothetical protein